MKIQFISSKLNFDQEQFGEVRDKRSWLSDLTVILTEDECVSLAEMTKSKNGILLYRATNDGFKGENFHNKCDNQQGTITIIKTNLDFVFGGYTSASWTNIEKYVNDEHAFIFSLRKKGVSRNEKFMVQEPNHAICGFREGVRFGFGSDILICNDSNLEYGSYTNFGVSYRLPEGYEYGTEMTRSYLAGNYNHWLTKEIEIYKITT